MKYLSATILLKMTACYAMLTVVGCSSSERRDSVEPNNTGGTSSTGGTDGNGGEGADTVPDPCPNPATPNRVVDDFESGVTSTWYYFDDGTGTLNPPEAVSGGAPDSTGALVLTGEGFTDWGVGIGVDLNCTDISMAEGVSFWARGNVDVTIQVGIPASIPVASMGTCLSGCYDHPSKTFTVTDTWQQYSVTWAELRQGNGTALPAATNNVVRVLQFSSFGVNAVPSFEYAVDDVVFLGANLPDPSGTGGAGQGGADGAGAAGGAGGTGS